MGSDTFVVKYLKLKIQVCFQPMFSCSSFKNERGRVIALRSAQTIWVPKTRLQVLYSQTTNKKKEDRNPLWTFFLLLGIVVANKVNMLSSTM